MKKEILEAIKESMTEGINVIKFYKEYVAKRKKRICILEEILDEEKYNIDAGKRFIKTQNKRIEFLRILKNLKITEKDLEKLTDKEDVILKGRLRGWTFIELAKKEPLLKALTPSRIQQLEKDIIRKLDGKK